MRVPSSKRSRSELLDTVLREPGARARVGWKRLELQGGEWFWRRGEPADCLAWIERGSLRVLVDGDERGVVGAGELLGEASALTPHERRTADLQAIRPTVLWTLGRARLVRLRREQPAFFDAVLDAAIATLSARLSENEHELARRREGEDVVVSTAPGMFRRLVRGLAGRAAPPSFAASLPALDQSEDAVVEELAATAQPLFLEPGEALCLEGDPADSMYLVAEGSFRVVLASAKGGVIEAGKVGPASLLGTSAMLQGRPRTASLVATEPTWVYELSREAIGALSDATWRALAELLLVALREQLVRVHASTIRSKGARGTISLEDAMPLLGDLQGWSLDRAVLVTLSELPDLGPPLELEPATREKIELVRNSVVGCDVALRGPFGLKRVVYADYTASGRPLGFIEAYLRERVMPLYANTHTEASASGLQTTEFREQARKIVLESVGGDERDAVIFVGSGATGAVNKLVGILNLKIPPDLDARHGLSKMIPADERPVVFVGPYEHHSNILPWKHTIADVVTIGLDEEGQVDLRELEERLVEYADRPLKIGTFSAASNVTGIKADTIALATLLHRHGALSFWDYAAAAPYVQIAMNPSGPGVDEALARKDAIFISPHKFVGGPGTPGVLVIKRALAGNTVPADPGGGTVDFVSSAQALYTEAIEAREEGGTPEILGSIRCGLVFQLKQQIGAGTIEAVEHDYVRRAIRAWRANPAIEIVGNPDADRLSITSFLVRHGRRFLHYGLVVALLNDVFGIQARGGCSCAGPYGGLLMGLGEGAGQGLFACAAKGWSSVKPGWARVNFNYFIGEDELRYVVSAVQLVAVYGWALAPRYDFDPRSGLWTHHDVRGHGHRVARLEELRIDGGVAAWNEQWPTAPASALEEQLAQGRALLEAALEQSPPALEAAPLESEVEALRWFPLPHELAADLREHQRARGAEDARLSAYRNALQAYGTTGASFMRVALSVSPEEHATVVQELAAEPR
jgi:selenocysteine lyase/cysteine desulfurase/CRP-like cAMP-binding protein